MSDSPSQLAKDAARDSWLAAQGFHVLRFANAAAGLSCTRPGAMASVPKLAEVQAFVRSQGQRDERDAPRPL